MTYVHTANEDALTGRAAELFAKYRAELGYVPNYLQLFASRPDVYDAWRRLLGSIRGELEPRRYLLATLAAAQDVAVDLLRGRERRHAAGRDCRRAADSKSRVRRIASDRATPT
jgi:hypothetical protein